MRGKLIGIIAAAATPLNADLSINLTRLVQHCGWLLSQGCDGINLLGTTGEATSFSVEQRLEAMTAIARSELPLNRFMVGTGAASLDDAVRLTIAAKALGYAGALLLPPFYYKGIDSEGLTEFVATIVARVGKSDLPSISITSRKTLEFLIRSMLSSGCTIASPTSLLV